MSSGSKKKADLVALFRLEFYRKQSNWKFCSQVQKAKLEKKSAASVDKATCTTEIVKNKHVEKSLNKTYNVETEKDGEKSVLNEAFLETDDDKNLPSLQNSLETPTWSPKIIKITDKWSPPACGSLNDTVNINPQLEKPELIAANLESPKSDLNLTGTIDGDYQILSQESDVQKQSCPLEGQNWEQFRPYLAYNQNFLDNMRCNQNAPQEKYENSLQETKFNQNWLQPETKYEGLENNYQNCQNITKEQNWSEYIENWPQNESKVLQNWANIPQTQNNFDHLEINNNNYKQDTDWSKNKIPEPVYTNWLDLKESQVMPDVAQNLQQNWPGLVWQNEVQWQGREDTELPELDKDGQEGTEARWPWEAQIWTKDQLFPEDIWSDDVLRELELLNVNDLEPDEPAEGEKWVPSDRLLQWMLVNKECCDDVLEVSCESLEQFMRAAHCAPHSSEVDLQPQLDDALEAPAEAEAWDEAVGAWSWARLREAGRGHARALRRVARELRARRRIVDTSDSSSLSAYPTPTPRYDNSCEEYPTRDIGLYQPAFIDTFISGSFKNDPNSKLLEKNKDLDEKERDEYKTYEGQISVQGGQIVVRGKSGEWGETERKKSQVIPDWGKIEPNKGQVSPSWGEIEPKRCKKGKLRVQGDQIVIDQCEISPDQSQTDLECQKDSLWGNYEIIGRGRGRVLFNDSKTGAGRGRGRL